MKNTYTIIFVLLLVAFGGWLFFSHKSNKETASMSSDTQIFNPQNATFTLEGKSITLKDGVYESAVAPDSDAKEIVKYSGGDTYGDLNFDGLDDAVFFVTENGGGTGVFTYVVAAINTGNSYKTTNAFFVGDRIIEQSISIPKDSGEIDVNYLDRKQGEAMATVPTQPATLVLKVTNEGVLEGLSK